MNLLYRPEITRIEFHVEVSGLLHMTVSDEAIQKRRREKRRKETSIQRIREWEIKEEANNWVTTNILSIVSHLPFTSLAFIYIHMCIYMIYTYNTLSFIFFLCLASYNSVILISEMKHRRRWRFSNPHWLLSLFLS